MSLLKTQYLHCTCSHQFKLHQDCIHYTVVYKFIQSDLTLRNSEHCHSTII